MKVRIVEVGPRDGLQNEPTLVPTSTKLQWVRKLRAAGEKELELGAFVRPERVPQMADTPRIVKGFLSKEEKPARSDLRNWCLVPNAKGLERAWEAGVDHLALFTAATDGFTMKNIGVSVDASLQEYSEVILQAKRLWKSAGRTSGRRLRVRGYVSTAFGCPFEGKVAPSQPLKVVEKLLAMGIDEISIGDTIGVATPRDVERVMRPALKMAGAAALAGHFHDTRGGALANALRSLDLGVRILDASAGGLGGCPFAPGATGNLATEDLVYLLEGMGVRTGIDLNELCRATDWLAQRMKRSVASRYWNAWKASSTRSARRQ
jgi:hydroxymethylglutaryl-CoA lyase